MTDDELLKIIRRGAERLSHMPVSDQERALAELKASVEKIARLVGYSAVDGSVFADELVQALRAASAPKRPQLSSTLH